MTDEPHNQTAKNTMHVAVHAMHGFHASEGYARAAGRIPTVGPILGLLVRAAGTVAGAAHGIKTLND